MNPHERAAATNAVLARFRDKPFAWEGAANCVHLARAQLAAFGHQVPPVPMFRTALGAKRALHKRGFANLRGLIGAYVPEIPPATMWVGDIALIASEDEWGGLGIFDGYSKLIGWCEEDPSGLRALTLNRSARITASWRL